MNDTEDLQGHLRSVRMFLMHGIEMDDELKHGRTLDQPYATKYF